MKKYHIKIYNIILYISCFIAFLALYCRVTISQKIISLNIDSDIKVACFFLIGVVFSASITVLLHYLFEHHLHQK